MNSNDKDRKQQSKDSVTYDLAVIGGGPAGMMAAGTAASSGLNTLLIEKNEKLGKKLYLTGKGRCNLTNDSSFDELLANTVTNRKFLYSAFRDMDSKAVQHFFTGMGLKLKTERGRRVFPLSDKSSDVIKTLQHYLTKNNVTTLLNTTAAQIITEQLAADEKKPQQVSGVMLADGSIINARAVLLAGGGTSYPSTGSDGSGYDLAASLGHTIVAPQPALIPMLCTEQWAKNLQGLSLKNVEVTLSCDRKTSFRQFGEMLFTHFGVSGPAILSLSSLGRPWLQKTQKEISLPLYIDLKPALSAEQLTARIQRDLNSAGPKQLKNSLDHLLPQRLIPVVIELAGLDPTKQSSQLNKDERNRLAAIIKRLPLTISGTRPISEAIITGGGINIKEIDPSTMESRLVENLFFAGEIMDVDALTGGFNLQIAFATGHLGATGCARKLL